MNNHSTPIGWIYILDGQGLTLAEGYGTRDDDWYVFFPRPEKSVGSLDTARWVEFETGLKFPLTSFRQNPDSSRVRYDFQLAAQPQELMP